VIPVAPIDVESLDRGIRLTVTWLRTKGFRTVDSGDGMSKGNDGEPDANVYMVTTPDAAVGEANLLSGMLRSIGVPIVPQGQDGGVWVCASYDPADGSAVLSVHRLDDALLGKALGA